jgi:Uma2 family endonuclease
MIATGPKPITARQYMGMPEGPPYYQLIEGDLYQSPSNDAFHQVIVGNLNFIIRNYLSGHPVGKVHLGPSDVTLSDLNIFEPDLYFVSNARKPIMTRHGADGAPDLVIEVLSPRTAKFDRGIKREVYARAGVIELWIIDPDRKEVHVYHLPESADTPAGTYSGKQKFESKCFPGLKIPVAKVFEE